MFGKLTPMPSSFSNYPATRQPELPLGLPEIVPVWRPIHYLGSKLRLVESIREHILDLDPASGRVCDLFAGSGTASLSLSSGRSVVAADIQEYSRVLCSALLRPAALNDAGIAHFKQRIERQRRKLEQIVEPLLEYEANAMDRASAEPAELCELVENGSLLAQNERGNRLAIALEETRKRISRDSTPLMATRYFGGIYFSYQQSLYLDSALDAIGQMQEKEMDTYLAALLSTASTIVNSVGKQFAQPMRPRRTDGTIKQHLISQMRRDRLMDAGKIFSEWLSRYIQLPRGGDAHQIIRGDYREVLPQLEDVSVIYADPPYTRDHYSRYYHVLETLCLRDFPDISTTLLTGIGESSRGLYRTDRHQSPFCIKSKAPAAFSSLFEGAKKLGVPILVSYSPYVRDGHPRLMTVDAVAKVAAKHYSHVEITPARSFSHSKLNKSELHLDASMNAEVFIICKLR